MFKSICSNFRTAKNTWMEKNYSKHIDNATFVNSTTRKELNGLREQYARIASKSISGIQKALLDFLYFFAAACIITIIYLIVEYFELL